MTAPQLAQELKDRGLMGIQVWVADEARVGLMQNLGRRITCRGVKPWGDHRYAFSYKYLFGGFNVQTGDYQIMEADSVNTSFFEEFLRQISNQDPMFLKVVVVDNAAYHKSKRLQIPRNILLYFLPPYTPELNSSERAWQEMRRFFKSKLILTLQRLSDTIDEYVNSLDRQKILNTVAYPVYKSFISAIRSVVPVF